MSDKEGCNTKKKVKVTSTPTPLSMSPTEAYLLMQIEEEKPTRPDLLQIVQFCARSIVVVSKSAVVHADGCHQPELLLDLRGPSPILS